MNITVVGRLKKFSFLITFIIIITKMSYLLLTVFMFLTRYFCPLSRLSWKVIKFAWMRN